MTRKIAFVVYPGFDLLDLSGPMSVFCDARQDGAPAYAVSVVSETGGEIDSTVGLSVATQPPPTGRLDTLVVVGGHPAAFRNPPPETIALVGTLAGQARRVASVCAGAFLLGDTGLLSGKHATTHWRYASELQARVPDARIDAERIFIQDGHVWTSAGATAGIDLALAMVEEDLGLDMSREVARGLVVYQRRLGGQSQYSALLELEPPSDRIRQVLSFARDHLHEPLPVPQLAEIARLSPRQFGRAFLAETGTSPAKAIERLRAEAARPLVEDSRKPLDQIAREVGFADPDRMRQAFVRVFGQPPQTLRRAGRETLELVRRSSSAL
jgi:transcriptional regulator GlxA family with amidase domain